MTKTIKFYDTCGLLDEKVDVLKEEFFMTSSKVLNELESIKTSKNKDDEVKYRARLITRFLRNNVEKYQIVNVTNLHYRMLEEFDLQPDNDNLIIMCAKEIQENMGYDITFITNDLACANIAEFVVGLKVEMVSENRVNDTADYKGYKFIMMDEYQLANWYELEVKINSWDLKINEYLVIRNPEGTILDKWKWTVNGFENVKYRAVDNKFIGKVKPRNIQQELLFDMLQDEEIKVKLTTGGYGTGKDYVMLSDAFSKIEKGKYDKLVWIRNIVEVKNSGAIGFLPGTATEKMMPYVMLLSDIVGGQYGIEFLLSSQKLELQHLSTIRGRSFKNCILYCSEGENLTREHVQLILSRIGENSLFYINGDYKQADKQLFQSDSGINILKERLTGNPAFGFVELEKTERSKTAELASLLD